MKARMPDNPKPISYEMLEELETCDPGMWMASPKLDGYRRILIKHQGFWHSIAKHAGEAARPFDEILQEDFNAIEWPEGIGLDCEWIGPRHVGQRQELFIFDLIYLHGEWIGDTPFRKRIEMLKGQVGPILPKKHSRIQLMPYVDNPGMLDLFMKQLQDPLSEGIVLRKSDSTLAGSVGKCADNPFMFKVKFK